MLFDLQGAHIRDQQKLSVKNTFAHFQPGGVSHVLTDENPKPKRCKYCFSRCESFTLDF